MLYLPFHRIFIEIVINYSKEVQKTVIFQKIEGCNNLILPLQYEELPRLLFQTGPSSIIAILTTFFQKNENIGVQILQTVHSQKIPYIAHYVSVGFIQQKYQPFLQMDYSTFPPCMSTNLFLHLFALQGDFVVVAKQAMFSLQKNCMNHITL